jgi:hydrogenase expression/formation protein HypE
MPSDPTDTVRLGHGGGGRLSRQLLEHLILPRFAPAGGVPLDAALLPPLQGRLAFSTDSYVVRPLFFPGGDIGALAVIGTANDLAMVGARPLAISLALILEEGLALATLERVLDSVAAAAALCGVEVVTGDTKVVERGKGDGLFLNTAGLGLVDPSLAIGPAAIGPAAIRTGDAILVSGDLGRHGVAILAARKELGITNTLPSDLAPLQAVVQELLASGLEIHALRDLTRGGLAAALEEIAAAAGLAMVVQETELPVAPAVRGACDLLGLEPIAMANEGRFLVVLPQPQAEAALDLLRRHQPTAQWIGRVEGPEVGRAEGRVRLENALGVRRLLDPGRGEQLPRIC